MSHKLLELDFGDMGRSWNGYEAVASLMRLMRAELQANEDEKIRRLLA